MRDGPDHLDPVDDVVGAFVERLKAMPVSDPRARAAILARVRGRRQSPWRATLTWAWQPSVPLLAAAAVVVAALGVGYGSRIMVEPQAPLAARGDGLESYREPVAGNGALTMVPVRDDAEARLVPVQFVFPAAKAGVKATRIAVVGDFNGWNHTLASAALKDPAGTGVWEVTLLLPPGRHSYAFLINDTLQVADPRMPREPVDPDFGRPRSAILVTQQ